jgi:hypothetical protein
MKKLCLILAISLLSTSCRLPTNFGFYQPITLDLTVPDGPPEFKAGWHDGCKSGASTGSFVNGIVYRSKAGPTFSPVYQHSGAYKDGWGAGYYGCYGYLTHFVTDNWHPSPAPLQ